MGTFKRFLRTLQALLTLLLLAAIFAVGVALIVKLFIIVVR